MARRREDTQRGLEKEISTLVMERRELDKRLETLDQQLVQVLCVKSKKECEPAYCVFRYTNSCSYLKRVRKLKSF